MKLILKIRNDNKNYEECKKLFDEMDALYYDKKVKRCRVNTYLIATFRYEMVEWVDKEMTSVMCFFSHLISTLKREDVYIDLTK